ncbi:MULTISPECIES: hypothetical protein [Pseudomonas]|uniref:hypothetical protein n=1 Tax=Pseudomonas TaxID=286 RepID=UPI0011C3B3D7|nr:MULTISPECIES: hypothetical protein [Pseudomonas]
MANFTIEAFYYGSPDDQYIPSSPDPQITVNVTAGDDHKFHLPNDGISEGAILDLTNLGPARFWIVGKISTGHVQVTPQSVNRFVYRNGSWQNTSQNRPAPDGAVDVAPSHA